MRRPRRLALVSACFDVAGSELGQAGDYGVDFFGLHVWKTSCANLLRLQAEPLAFGFAEGVVTDDVDALAILQRALHGGDALQVVFAQIDCRDNGTPQDRPRSLGVNQAQVCEDAVVREARERLVPLGIGFFVVEQEEIHEGHEFEEVTGRAEAACFEAGVDALGLEAAGSRTCGRTCRWAGWCNCSWCSTP